VGAKTRGGEREKKESVARLLHNVTRSPTRPGAALIVSIAWADALLLPLPHVRGPVPKNSRTGPVKIGTQLPST